MAGEESPRVYAPTVPIGVQAGHRHRQSRAIANDERVLDAALQLIDHEGWRGLSVAGVAAAAGVSRTVVLNRFKDRPALAVGMWHQRVAEPLNTALNRVVDTVTASADAPLTGPRLWTALEPFAIPDRKMRAAAELLIIGRYEPRLREAIGDTLAPYMRQWLNPAGGASQRTHAAVRAFALNIAFGLLVEARRHPLDSLDFTAEMTRLAGAVAHPVAPTPLPRARASHLDRVDNFDTGDPDLNQLLRVTLEEVGTRGYEAATIDQIAGATDHTPGFIFSRHSSKRELFLTAQAAYASRAAMLNEEFIQSVMAASGLGVAEAVATRELMRPERLRVMTVSAEMYRLSWHDPDILRVIDEGYEDVFHAYREKAGGAPPARVDAMLVMELARGNGPQILAGLSDTAWKLPYDVVTVPLTRA